MTSLEKSLGYIGLKPKEIKIYLSLLELGEAQVTDIARRAGIKRTTVYNLLPDLIDRGVVTVRPHRKRKLYYVDDARALKQDLLEKEKVIDRIMPELTSLQKINPLKPKISYYEGLGGMRDLYQDTLDSSKSGETILSYTGLANFYEYMPADYMKSYIEERIKRKIGIKMIAPRSHAAIEFDRVEKKELRDIRLAEAPSFTFSADTEIYANKVALISYRENFLGVIIESEDIHNMQHLAFEMMWRSLPPQ